MIRLPSLRASLAIVIRAFGMLVVALASLQLALVAASGLFLVRQGQGSLRDLPVMIAWNVVIIIGLAVYAWAGRIGDRLWAGIRSLKGGTHL